MPSPLVLLIGPAGCGKTTVGRPLADALDVRFVDADDLHSAAAIERMRRGEALGDAERAPWLDRVRHELERAAASGTGLVVGCSALRAAYRERLRTGLAVRCVQLDVPPDELRARLAARRDHFFPASLLDSQLAAFEPLGAAERVDATQELAVVVRAIRELLARPAARIVDALALPTYDLGPDHPFAPDRQHALFDLLRRTGAMTDADVLATAPLDAGALARVHDLDYVRCLIATSMPLPSDATIALAPQHGLGAGDNPIAEGQHDAAAAVAGATVAAVDAVFDGMCRAAFNPAGGLHHAMPDRAAGFCLYNDLALAMHRAFDRGAERVLYVDFDVHHGDGVEAVFRGDPNALTISFHEDPRVRYPGTGFVEDIGTGEGRGKTLNVPLAPGTTDASFVEVTERVLTAAGAGFRPDLIVSQHGCDTHREDPLATLECTTAVARRNAELCRRLADRWCEGRWVATGGGGYRPRHVIPRAWALVWGALADRKLPHDLPEEWRQRWQQRADDPLPRTITDADAATVPYHERAAATNRATVDRLFELVDWLGPAAAD